jgi:putative peptidoglycan lipid II flippase
VPAPDPSKAHPTTGRRRIALNTLIFSVLTGLSRVVGLVREVVAARYYGTGAAMSAFTLAFQIPNLVRSLFADAALSAAFVPVFTELLEQGRRREAYKLAAELFGLIAAVLTAITAVFVVAAPFAIPLFTSEEFTASLDALAVGLTQLLFPIVVLLGLNGLVVGILNAYDHFSIPALAPVVWNLVIIAALIGLDPLFQGNDRVYAYAIGVLAGTAVQFLMSLYALRRIDFKLRVSFSWQDPRIRQVLTLMAPVAIGLGLINFNLLINSFLGLLVSEEAPAAIDKAFRIYMLPQGMFSVAVATVLFPTLARLATRDDRDGMRATVGNGSRQILLLLVPAAAATLVLAEPITRLVYERGAFDEQSTELTSEALFWFSFSLPTSGLNLLLTRTFFSLQQPWFTTKLAAFTLVVNAAVSAALVFPLGIAGIVLGTVASTAAMAIGQSRALARELHGLELRRTAKATAMILWGSLILGATAYTTWLVLDDWLGRSLPAQVISVGLALGLGSVAYAAILLSARVPEARQIADLLTARLRARRAS